VLVTTRSALRCGSRCRRLPEILCPGLVGPRCGVASEARLLVVHGSQLHVMKGECRATGGSDPVASSSPRLHCDSAWHFKQSWEVPVAVVNVKSATAMCSGAIAGASGKSCSRSCVVELVAARWSSHSGWLRVRAGPARRARGCPSRS